MPVNNQNVLAGKPDQLVTGAILSSVKLVADPPEDPYKSLGDGFKDSGYISEDGVSLSVERSTSDIKDWSGAVVKRILEEFKGQLSWAHLETNEESLKNFAGDENVTVEPATSEHGRRVKVTLKGDELPHKTWAIKMKDGKQRMIIWVPDGQVVETEDIEFSGTEALTWGVTLACYPDKYGNSIYIFLDDGVVAG